MLGNETYRLEILNGVVIPRTWLLSVLSFILNEFYYFGEQFNCFDENFYDDTLLPVITRASSLKKLWLLFMFYITKKNSYQTNLVDDISTNGLTWSNPMIRPTRPSWFLQTNQLGRILRSDQLGHHDFYKRTDLDESYDRTNPTVTVSTNGPT